MNTMANEAILRHETAIPLPFTVVNGTGVEKGTLMVLSGGASAAASAATSHGSAFAGIAATEKIANDGKTKLGLYTQGVFDLVVATGGTVTLGQIVSLSGANRIKTALEAEIAAGGGIGKALETGTGDLTIQVAVGYI